MSNKGKRVVKPLSFGDADNQEGDDGMTIKSATRLLQDEGFEKYVQYVLNVESTLVSTNKQSGEKTKKRMPRREMYLFKKDGDVAALLILFDEDKPTVKILKEWVVEEDDPGEETDED
mgnify:FL=1